MDTTTPAEPAAAPIRNSPSNVRGYVIAVVILSLLLLRIFWVHYQKEQTERKKVASLVGKWFCRTTFAVDKVFQIGKSAQVHEITVVLNQTGEGALAWLEDGDQADSAQGKWGLKDDFLIINRPGDGFAAFRIGSQGDNRLTLVNRTGLILEFSRVN